MRSYKVSSVLAFVGAAAIAWVEFVLLLRAALVYQALSGMQGNGTIGSDLFAALLGPIFAGEAIGTWVIVGVWGAAGTALLVVGILAGVKKFGRSGVTLTIGVICLGLMIVFALWGYWGSWL